MNENYTIFSLFDDLDELDKENDLQTAIDGIRNQFGFLAIQKGTNLLDSSRSVARSKLVGGHSAGGLEGLK